MSNIIDKLKEKYERIYTESNSEYMSIIADSILADLEELRAYKFTEKDMCDFAQWVYNVPTLEETWEEDLEIWQQIRSKQ